jgi:hypothetical protein
MWRIRISVFLDIFDLEETMSAGWTVAHLSLDLLRVKALLSSRRITIANPHDGAAFVWFDQPKLAGRSLETGTSPASQALLTT